MLKSAEENPTFDDVSSVFCRRSKWCVCISLRLYALRITTLIIIFQCGTIDSDDAKMFSAALDSVEIVTTAGFWIVTGILGWQ